MPRLNPHDRPTWTRAVQWLWQQDGRTPVGKQIEDAWLQAFDEALPPRSFYVACADGVFRYVDNPAWHAYWAFSHDGGDHEYRVTPDGRVWFSGCNGDAVGLVSGPHALIR